MAQCTAKSKQSGERCKRQVTPGKQVCYYHGGRSLSGIASPRLTTGKWSKYVPVQLGPAYEEYRNDTDLLSLNDDVALLRSITAKHLGDMGQGDTSPAWIAVKLAFDEMEAAEAQGVAGLDKYLKAKAKLLAIIEPNYRAAIAEGQVIRNIDQLSKVVDKERRLLIDKQMMISVAEVNLYMRVILSALIKSVNEFCDKATGNRILSYVQDAYSQAASRSRDMAVIDAGD